MSNSVALPADVFAGHSEQDVAAAYSPQKDFYSLERLYTIENPFEVKSFLAAHPNLKDYLFETHEQIERFFGNSALEICLKHDSDPEEDYEGLFVIVETHLSPEEALDLLDKFDDEWFLDHVPPEVSSILTVGV
jgi:hypothetical protein